MLVSLIAVKQCNLGISEHLNFFVGALGDSVFALSWHSTGEILNRNVGVNVMRWFSAGGLGENAKRNVEIARKKNEDLAVALTWRYPERSKVIEEFLVFSILWNIPKSGEFLKIWLWHCGAIRNPNKS